MAKQSNMIPMPTGKLMPKLIGILVAVALIVIVVKYPGEAANWAKALFGWGEAFVDGLVSFFRQLG